jgi:hypothetical protein
VVAVPVATLRRVVTPPPLLDGPGARQPPDVSRRLLLLRNDLPSKDLYWLSRTSESERDQDGMRREGRLGGGRLVGIFVPWQAVALTLAVVVGITALAVGRTVVALAAGSFVAGAVVTALFVDTLLLGFYLPARSGCPGQSDDR